MAVELDIVVLGSKET